jgi:cytochrome P450
MPDLEWRWLAWASKQPERNVDVDRRNRLIAVTERSSDAAARFEAIRAQEEALDRAVEELLRWTAPGTVVPLTASKDVQITLESAPCLILRGDQSLAGPLQLIHQRDVP